MHETGTEACNSNFFSEIGILVLFVEKVYLDILSTCVLKDIINDNQNAHNEILVQYEFEYCVLVCGCVRPDGRAGGAYGDVGLGNSNVASAKGISFLPCFKISVYSIKTPKTKSIVCIQTPIQNKSFYVTR